MTTLEIILGAGMVFFAVAAVLIGAYAVELEWRLGEIEDDL